jgi:hypothetical protein
MAYILLVARNITSTKCASCDRYWADTLQMSETTLPIKTFVRMCRLDYTLARASIKHAHFY